MKIRFTPLNVVSAVLLVSSIYFIVFTAPIGWKVSGTISLFLLAFICFISDLVFRRYLLITKRIWLFELLFIILVIALIVVIRGVVFN